MLIFVSFEDNNTPDNPLPSPVNDVAFIFPLTSHAKVACGAFPIPTLPVSVLVPSQVRVPAIVVFANPCPISLPILKFPFVVYRIKEWIELPESCTAISVFSKHSINNPAVFVFQLAVPPP